MDFLKSFFKGSDKSNGRKELGTCYSIERKIIPEELRHIQDAQQVEWEILNKFLTTFTGLSLQR